MVGNSICFFLGPRSIVRKLPSGIFQGKFLTINRPEHTIDSVFGIYTERFAACIP